MSYHKGTIRCDICGNHDFPPASPLSDGRPLDDAWKRIASENEDGIPEHTCSPECEAKGREMIAHFEATADPERPFMSSSQEYKDAYAAKKRRN
jgi:hypothetical protein